MKHLIIGNGIAAINAAGAIRELDTSSEICMVSDETGPPYSRPMISNLLDGSQTPERLPLFTGDIYKDLDISPVLGQRVSRIDVAGKSVRTADGRDIGYDRLLVASGADARRLNVPGSDLGNIFYMRTKADATAQVVALSQSPQNALVLGGGLVGFKAAYGLIKRGIPTTMLITSDYPLAMQVDETAGRMILRALESRGLTVRTGVSVSAFDGETLVRQATLDTGETLDCDYVIVGKGVEPAMQNAPARDAGVKIIVCSHVPLRADMHANDALTFTQVGHHFDGKVVHVAAIDQDLAILHHGRPHAGNGGGSPNSAPQRTPLEHNGFRG